MSGKTSADAPPSREPVEWSERHGERPKGAGVKLDYGRRHPKLLSKGAKPMQIREIIRSALPHRIGQTAAGIEGRRENPSAGLDKPGGHGPEAR